MIGYPQIQSHPSPQIWDGSGGLLDEAGRTILDERGRALQQDRGLGELFPTIGLYAHYSADSLSFPSSTEISALSDLSGTGNDLAKTGTGSLRWINAGLNGLPIVRAATDDLTAYLNRNSINMLPAGPVVLGGTMTGVTIAMVARRLASGTFPTSYVAAPNFLNNVGGIRATVSNGGVGPNVTWDIEGNYPLVETLSDWQVLTLRFNNSDTVADFRTNTQTGGGVYGATVDDTSILFGNVRNEIAESFWYRQALSDGELQIVRLYLANKYGLTITV